MISSPIPQMSLKENISQSKGMKMLCMYYACIGNYSNTIAYTPLIVQPG